MNDVRCVRAVRVLCCAEEHACSSLRKENPGERHNNDVEQHRGCVVLRAAVFRHDR